jgi:hypothetical protein
MTPKRILAAAGVMLLVWASGFAQKQEKAQTPSKSGPAQAKPAEAKKPRARVVTDLSGFDLLESGKLKTQTQVAGATRGMSRPVALAPRLGKLYGDQPTFSWKFEGKAKSFLFVLEDDARTELFRAEVTGYEYRYPATAPALQPGKTYFWTVEVASAMFGGEPSAPAGLLLLNAAQRAEVEKELAAAAFPDAYQSGLARARAFRDRRLWYDALDAYSGLIARFPDRAELYEQRGMIYAQFDATKPLGEKDFAREEELQNAASHH